jgi:DNA-binding NtrC family response regulator
MKNGDNTVVLVIDDDAVVRQRIAARLSENGFRVVLASSSDEGINAYHSACPHLVICDINMADKKGFDTLDLLFTQNPVQPIIILSDVGNTEDVIRAMRLGVSDYLFKPLEDMEMLAISIENTLNRARLIEENARYRKKPGRDQSRTGRTHRDLPVRPAGWPSCADAHAADTPTEHKPLSF